MDRHGPLGRLPVRIAGAAPATALLLAAGLVAGCGGTPLEAATMATPTTTTAASTTTPAPTTTTTPTLPPTTTSTASTSTTTIPPEPWIVEGQRYYFPVQPPEVATYGRYHHDYPATDIFAPAGSTYVAATDGVIDEVRHDDPWDPATNLGGDRGGRFVSLVGDDGVRYYCSHLDTVIEGLRAGDRVTAGQVLGTIGRSGNAAATSPHCHFGISRPTGAGDWAVRRGEVWPYDYLQAWAQGEDVTPELPEG